jgi:hypothetical protein
VLVALIAVVFSGFLVLLSAGNPPPPYAAASDVTNRLIALFAAAATLAVAAIALRFAARAQRQGNVQSSVICTFGAYAGALCAAGIAAFPAVDQWQNLPLLAESVNYQSRGAPLGLLDPDETTIAILDDRLRTSFDVLETNGASASQVVSSWFSTRGTRARVLVLLPGHASGNLSEILNRIHPARPPGDGIAGTLSANGTATIVARFELPHGRRYALLAPPAS